MGVWVGGGKPGTRTAPCSHLVAPLCPVFTTLQPDIVVLMDGMEANTQEYAPELTIEKAYFSYGSDHVSFQRAGIPAFLVRAHPTP